MMELIREVLTEDSGEADGVTMAERITTASLRSLRLEERGPVERTLLLFAVFSGGISIPMVVLEALVGLDEEEVPWEVLTWE